MNRAVSATMKTKKTDLNKTVTLGVLLEYTDEFLLPRIGEMFEDSEKRLKKYVNEENGQLKHELKTYIDDKLADYTSDIFKRLDKKYQKDHAFKEKVVTLFKKHRIGSAEEIAFLEGLVTAS